MNKNKKLNDILIKTLEKSLIYINENKANNNEKKVVNAYNIIKNNDINLINNNFDY